MDLNQADSYKRRIYTLEGESLANARRIELLVKVVYEPGADLSAKAYLAFGPRVALGYPEQPGA